MFEPLETKNISISCGHDITYFDDCVENTLLRFFQLLCSKDGFMQFDILEKIISNENIIDFFKKNNVVFEKDFYDTEQGINIRSEWANILSNLSNIIYNKYNCEIQANIHNIINILYNILKIKNNTVARTTLLSMDHCILYDILLEICDKINTITKILSLNNIEISKKILTQNIMIISYKISLRIYNDNFDFVIYENIINNKRISGHCYAIINNKSPNVI